MASSAVDAASVDLEGRGADARQHPRRDHEFLEAISAVLDERHAQRSDSDEEDNRGGGDDNGEDLLELHQHAPMANVLFVLYVATMAYTHVFAVVNLFTAMLLAALRGSAQTCAPEYTFALAITIVVLCVVHLLRGMLLLGGDSANATCRSCCKATRKALLYVQTYLSLHIAINAPTLGVFGGGVTTQCSRAHLPTLLLYVRWFYILFVGSWVVFALAIVAFFVLLQCGHHVFHWRWVDALLLDGGGGEAPPRRVSRDTLRDLTRLLPYAEVAQRAHRPANVGGIGGGGSDMERGDATASVGASDVRREGTTLATVASDNDVDGGAHGVTGDDTGGGNTGEGGGSACGGGNNDDDDEQASDSVLDKCAICLDAFVDTDDNGAAVMVRELGCGHYFHDECVSPYLTGERGMCPICKQPLNRARDLRAAPSPLLSSPPPPATQPSTATVATMTTTTTTTAAASVAIVLPAPTVGCGDGNTGDGDDADDVHTEEALSAAKCIDSSAASASARRARRRRQRDQKQQHGRHRRHRPFAEHPLPPSDMADGSQPK